VAGLLSFQDKQVPERSVALVAFPGGSVVFARGRLLTEEIRENGYNAEDVGLLGVRDKWSDGPAAGLWVWEGQAEVVKSETQEGVEYDLEFNGQWRAPSNIEWAKIQRGQNPFPETPVTLRDRVSTAIMECTRFHNFEESDWRGLRDEVLEIIDEETKT